MAKIEMNSYDFEIKEITDRQGEQKDIVQLRPGLAFNDEFLQEMLSLGVKKFIKTDE